MALVTVRVAFTELQPICDRSEEHTSELQSLRHLVCRLLLEKKQSLLRSKGEDGTRDVTTARRNPLHRVSSYARACSSLVCRRTTTPAAGLLYFGTIM